MWKQLGFKEVKSPSGNRKGFIDKEGRYISERQYRKEYALTPMKGSKGYKERQEAKKKGVDFRPVTVDKAWKELQAAAKKPGMTLAQFTTGKAPTLSQADKLITAKRNKFIDEQRREAIKFKKLAGVLTPKQAEQSLKDLEKQIKARDKALRLRERLLKPLGRKEREKLEKQYRKEAATVRKYQDKLEKRGVVLLDDLPSKESLRYGFYHA